jgi:hypothetical protein
VRKQLRAPRQPGPMSHFINPLLFCPSQRIATKLAARGEPARTQGDGNLLFYQHKMCVAGQPRTAANTYTRAWNPVCRRPLSCRSIPQGQRPASPH